MNALRWRHEAQTVGDADSVKQLNFGTPSPEVKLFPRGTMRIQEIAGGFAPQTGYAGDKLWRYLKFRARPGRKLSQGRHGRGFIRAQDICRKFKSFLIRITVSSFVFSLFLFLAVKIEQKLLDISLNSIYFRYRRKI